MFFLHKHPCTETNNEHIYVKVNKLVNEKVEACSPPWHLQFMLHPTEEVICTGGVFIPFQFSLC